MESLRDLSQSPGATPEIPADEKIPSAADPQLVSERSGTAYDDGPPMLRVHLVHEDAPTGTRGTRLVETLAENLKMEADFQLTSTTFETFGISPPWDISPGEAGDADILVVSAHGQDELPAAVVAWVQKWFKEQPDGPRALVISLDAEAEGSAWAGQIEATLHQNARLASVDVFSHYGRLADRERDFSLEDIAYRAETKTALMDEALRWEKPSSHWGINE